MSEVDLADVTPEQIRKLIADVKAEWRARGYRTSWPRGSVLLRDCVAALDVTCDSRRRQGCLARVAQEIEARVAEARAALPRRRACEVGCSSWGSTSDDGPCSCGVQAARRPGAP